VPEGPEIRRAADRIGEVLEGQRVEAVFFAFPELKPWEAHLTGQRVRRVQPRGKALLIRFANGLTMYSHNQLYGRWFIRDRDVTPATRRQLRAALHTATRSALLYSASEVAVLPDADLPQHPYLARLGLDPLDDETTPRMIRRRLEDRRFARRGLGALLLDQGFLSGIGNYLRSEILYDARVAPERRPVDLDASERLALARAAITITRRAYRLRGVTIEPARARRLAAAGRKRREYRHDAFGRAGEPCRRCGDTIVRTTVAGRRLYRCPGCQV
jgi:endonuclease-8